MAAAAWGSRLFCARMEPPVVLVRWQSSFAGGLRCQGGPSLFICLRRGGLVSNVKSVRENQVHDTEHTETD